METVYRNFITQDHAFLVLLTTFISIAFLKYRFEDRFEKLFNLSWAKNQSQHHRETQSFFNFTNICLYVLQAGVFGMLTQHLKSPIEFNGYKTGTYALIYLLFFSLIYGIERIIGVVFGKSETITHYINYRVSFLNITALITFPLFLISFFSTIPNADFGLITQCILTIISLVFLAFTFIKFKASLFSNTYYIILYFCALEIAPCYIFYKIIVFI